VEFVWRCATAPAKTLGAVERHMSRCGREGVAAGYQAGVGRGGLA
jgi:hypothetical protein